jgi:hypothetical protein
LRLDKVTPFHEIAAVANVHIPHLSRSVVVEHTITVHAGSPELRLGVNETQIRSRDGAVNPVSVALLAASRAAALRERDEMLTFHAIAIKHGHHAVIVAGPSLAGKTTTALQAEQLGWQLLAGNVVCVQADGSLVAGNINVTTRALGRPGDPAPFDLRHLRMIEPLGQPVPIAAIVLLSAGHRRPIAQPVSDAIVELLNRAGEMPRTTVVLGAELIDVGVDTSSTAWRRYELCSALAGCIDIVRLAAEPRAAAAWIDARWR